VAQNKIALELTPSEAAHLLTAAQTANRAHLDWHKRPNAALAKVITKIEKAQALSQADDLDPVPAQDAPVADK